MIYGMNRNWLAAALLGLLAGCGDGADAGRVAVKGSVELDGKPIAAATVAFIGGKGGGALASTTTDKDGKFQLRAAPGMNKVVVSKTESVAPTVSVGGASPESSLMGTPEEMSKKAKTQPKDLVPAKYANPDTSGLQFDVSSGMEPLSISLNSK
jgi:hypothetical protein